MPSNTWIRKTKEGNVVREEFGSDEDGFEFDDVTQLPTNDQNERETHQENDECEANMCMKPSEETLKWVMCNNCNKWLHFQCAGVITEPGETEDFVCMACRN